MMYIPRDIKEKNIEERIKDHEMLGNTPSRTKDLVTKLEKYEKRVRRKRGIYLTNPLSKGTNVWKTYPNRITVPKCIR